KEEAKDNGYYLFKFIRESETNKRVYYIIQKDSTQKAKVDELANVIVHNSLKHYLFFMLASKLVLTFEHSTFPDLSLFWLLFRLKILGKKSIFLQHGITKEKQIHYEYGNRFKFDLFVCSSPVEHRFVI